MLGILCWCEYQEREEREGERGKGREGACL